MKCLKKCLKKREEKFIKDLKEEFDLDNKSTTNWYDKYKFNKILTIIDSNNFNHKNKIDKFKFNDINDLINNINNNTISEANTQKKINELNKIKKVEIKGKRFVNGQKILLSLFDDLKTIFNNNNNNNNNNNSNNSNHNESDSENENESVSKDENENENENENESVKKDESENENESDDGKYYEIIQINNNFKKIDETKSFKDQIDILKEIPWLNNY